jgi:hypothetical protein
MIACMMPVKNAQKLNMSDDCSTRNRTDTEIIYEAGIPPHTVAEMLDKGIS